MGKKKTPFSKKLKNDFLYGKRIPKGAEVKIIEINAPDFPLSIGDIYGTNPDPTLHSKGALITKGKNYIKDLID